MTHGDVQVTYVDGKSSFFFYNIYSRLKSNLNISVQYTFLHMVNNLSLCKNY